MTNNKPNDVRVVSVELLEEALRRITSVRGKEVAAEISRILAQPADQQGEPDFYEVSVNGVRPALFYEKPEWAIEDPAYTVTGIYRHAQPATAKVDERVEFEEFFNDAAKRLPLIKGKSTTRYAGGQYVNDYALFGFMAWQARAKLNGGQS